MYLSLDNLVHTQVIRHTVRGVRRGIEGSVGTGARGALTGLSRDYGESAGGAVGENIREQHEDILGYL